MSKMEFQISIPVAGKPPMVIKETIEQLVYASNMENAKIAVEQDLKRQYPDAIIFECRIHRTIMGC